MEAKNVKDLREAYASVYTQSEETLVEETLEKGQAPSPGGVNPPSKDVKKEPLKGTGSRKTWNPPMKDSVDLFDIIKGHLLDEGYADTEEAALVIMANMSEEWRESIVEEKAQRRSKEERSKRAKELGDRQTIRNIVGGYNKGKSLSKQENPDKYYSNN